MNDLKLLIEKDDLKNIEAFDKKGFIHKDHRYTLPLVLHAQRKGFLPKPCDLICFDNHHDCCLPKDLEKLKSIDVDKTGITEFTKFCDQDLSKLDDDWIIAGIELGIFNNVIIFGVTRNTSSPRHIENNVYEDMHGAKHKIFIKSCHLGPMLAYQGDLSDGARDHLRVFWNTIGWEIVRGKGFNFKKNIEPFLFDIDLDCFSIYWSDFEFPWLEEVYKERYFKISDYGPTQGLYGKKVFQDFIKNSGFITIAKEPVPCGGEDKSNKILIDVKDYLFDGNLKILT